MAKEGGGAVKYDKNTEAFQMRAQWKKTDMCRKMWAERWSWLLDERKKTLAETEAIHNEAATMLPQVTIKKKQKKSLKPTPVTSTGFVGWLAAKPDCQLEIYTSWLTKIPLKAPDVWENKEYVGPKDPAP